MVSSPDKKIRGAYINKNSQLIHIKKLDFHKWLSVDDVILHHFSFFIFVLCLLLTVSFHAISLSTGCFAVISAVVYCYRLLKTDLDCSARSRDLTIVLRVVSLQQFSRNWLGS